MKLLSNAKLNLTLAVCEKRPDGYHDIESVMQSVSLQDEIAILKSNKLTLECSNPLLNGEKNIAYRAAKLFFDYTGIKSGAEIYLKKNIPTTAGLGGGSGNAAAVLIGLDRIFETKLSKTQLIDLGLKLGADVPFCIIGGTALVEGLGEKVTPIKNVKDLFFVIAKNGNKASTKDMYAKLDSAEEKFIPNTPAAVKAIEQSDITSLVNNIGNAFEPLTGLYGIDTALKDLPPLKICLAGSGPSVFAVYSNEISADRAIEHLKNASIECYKTMPLEKGVIITE